MNPYTASTDPARARIAAELARYYGLQAPDPEPAFSLSRLLRQLVSQHGLQTGREQEVCQAQSMAVGENWHQFAARLPWSALWPRRAPCWARRARTTPDS